VKAYIFINVTPDVKAAEFVAEVRRIPGITSADACWGLPDVIAVAQVPDVKDLQATALDKLQKVRGVSQTDTHIVAEV
jgi:DNA-binding Lrp family transcriptional regulator